METREVLVGPVVKGSGHVFLSDFRWSTTHSVQNPTKCERILNLNNKKVKPGLWSLGVCMSGILHSKEDL